VYRDDSTTVVPVATANAADPIRVPLGPMPGPVPGAVLKLTPDVMYVIDSDVAVRVLASPERLVRIVRDTGPLKVRGKFIDGNGKIETRSYIGKFLYFVEPVANGRVELLVIPTSEPKPDDSDVIRRVLDVEAGDGPRPPPDPDPKPKPPEPDPVTPAPIPVDGFRVMIVYETKDLGIYPGPQNAIFFSNKVRTYLDTKCVVGPDGKTREWRQYDKDVDMKNESQLWKDAFARPRGKLPWIVVSNGKTGFEGPLPADVDSTIRLLDKY
jgi:hypothetical protein